MGGTGAGTLDGVPRLLEPAGTGRAGFRDACCGGAALAGGCSGLFQVRIVQEE